MNHWQTFPARWSLLKPPLRPDASVIDCVRSLVGADAAPVLLLGVTPELAAAFADVEAVDRSAEMIAALWPGDGPGKRAIRGDWLDLCGEPRFAAVVGDGSPNALTSLEDAAWLLRIVVGLLLPGGSFACRLYERPAVPFTIDDLLATTSKPGVMNFHAFKWQLAMHIAETSSPTVHVASILERFDALFPDRDALAGRTGWARAEIDTIDVYARSPLAYTFPDRVEFTRLLPPGIEAVRFLPCGSYDMAACCPMLTFRKARP
jgi:hypothetical protein